GPGLAPLAPAARRAGRAAGQPRRGVILSPDVPRVVLLDVEPPVQPERARVHLEEPLRVCVAGELVEPLVLEQPEVLRADLRPLLHLFEVEVLTRPRLVQARADVEHGAASLDAIHARRSAFFPLVAKALALAEVGEQ